MTASVSMLVDAGSSNSSAQSSSLEVPSGLSVSMREAAGQACSLLKVLANEDRLLILCALIDGECNVGEFQQQLGIQQPTLSQQLAVLREEGLVQTRRQGKFIYYRLARHDVVAIVQTLSNLFCDIPAEKTHDD